MDYIQMFVEYVERGDNGNTKEVYFTYSNGDTTLEYGKYNHWYDGKVQKSTFNKFIN